ncbi:Ig-like domain-containing protein [Streptococcus suis]|uniref:Ig-like domain-containing protein n=1 Tax=Streptococcus suis TaxID=1307 RepID=UPI003BF7DAA3
MTKMKKILAFILLPVMILFSGYLGASSHVYGDETTNVITKMYFTDKDGNELTPPNVEQWQQFRLNADFDIKNNAVKEGDVIEIELPSELIFNQSSDFQITDKEGNVVANATITPEPEKKIKLTYTKYVEEHSDIKGSFYFYVRVDHRVIQQKKEIPLDITVQGKIIHAGKIQFQGIGTPDKRDIQKSGWSDSKNPQDAWFIIAINRSGQSMKDVKVVDVLKSKQLEYIPDTLRVEKGNWSFKDGDWVLDNIETITDQVTLTFAPDGKSFSIELPDLAPTDGIQIIYKTKAPYVPVDGEEFSNEATLITTNGIDQTVTSGYTYLAAGGKAEGYVFTIKVKKTDEAGAPLADVEFDVIRNRTGQSVGKITTDDQGEGSISNLLRDEYTLKEIKTPDGYLPIEDMVINPAEFDGVTKSVLKEIVNKKKPAGPVKVVLKATKTLEGRALADKSLNSLS